MSSTWFLAFIILVLIELCTVSLVSIWFAVGALITFICSYFISEFYIQMIIFITSSIISLLLTKKFVKKVVKKEPEKTNLDRAVGKIGIITEEIKSKNDLGEVKVDGKKWSCYSTKKILKDSKVEILSIDGVKLKVREIKEDL